MKDQPSRKNLGNSTLIRIVQILSWLITAVFIVTLIWSIYQAIVNKNPLPTWAWLGMTVLFTVAVGLGVMVLVYRGVARETGPFDFRPSQRLAGQLKHEAKRVETGGAVSLRVEIKMAEGNLQILGGAADIMEGDFTYDDADWKAPVLDYSVDANGQGDLLVEQTSTGRPAMKQGRCEWRLRLTPELPTDLKVKFGAGKANLDLSGLTLTGLRVESGVGELNLDLSADPERNLDVFVKSGIGDTSLRFPKNTGVRVRSTVGFGSIKPNGLNWDGEFYTNDLYGQSAATLEITIEGGMGKITLI